ncbi:MAG: hypothetical protein KGN36_02375, partial [Acidobacteriota bacterium]|nr:hypothetical protein [Acidobacteriota bacterium]
MLSLRTVLPAILLLAAAASGQQNGPALAVDAAAGRHPISPDIYGINFFWDLGSNNAAPTAASVDVRASARRWGGNNTSTYNWQLGVWNIDADWFYEVLPKGNPKFNDFADQARATGGRIIGTIPVLGWLPKAAAEMCSFDVAIYGNQCKVDPYAQYHAHTCGNGIAYDAACGNPSVNDGKAPAHPVYIKNDPNDAYAPFDPNYQADWVRSVVARYGPGNQGGVAIWALDNEPIWWDSTHRDIHPDPYTYDELLAVDTAYAAAVKRADPTALVSGPVSDNWASLWFSKKDIVSGWARGNYWSNPVDRNAHGGVPLAAWYLQQMRTYEQTHGVRLLDYLDVHAYIEPSALHTDNPSAAVQQLQLDSTREFWDPTYVVTNDYWIKDVDNGGAPVAPALIPRLRQIIADNYPGTKLAITEYNWTALNTLNGALAQADLLGIFGREGLDAATLWGPTSPTDPAAFAFRMYRNYDGIGGAFGDTGVQASSADPGSLAVYAALRADLNLTVMVINKTATDLAAPLSLANFPAGASAHVWQYSGAGLDAIRQQPDTSAAGGVINTIFPAYSITLLVIPPASLPVPKPVVRAVTNAASYASAIAPGQMVIVWGSGLGPVPLAGLQLDGNGIVDTAVSGVRILFDGVPAPIVYVSAGQCSAAVPYFGATKATTHVQVEYQGVRSDPLEIPVSSTAPGLFAA